MKLKWERWQSGVMHGLEWRGFYNGVQVARVVKTFRSPKRYTNTWLPTVAEYSVDGEFTYAKLKEAMAAAEKKYLRDFT